MSGPSCAVDAYRDLYGFGAQVTVIGVLEYIGLNLDTLLVGRFASATLLGFYNRSFVLVNLPLNQLMTGLSKVLFPSFSRVRGDRVRLRRAYLSALSVAAAVFFPLVAGMAVAAREIVLVLLGEQWEPVIAILPIIAASGAVKVLTHFSAVLAEAVGELRKKLLLQGVFVARPRRCSLARRGWAPDRLRNSLCLGEVGDSTWATSS